MRLAGEPTLNSRRQKGGSFMLKRLTKLFGGRPSPSEFMDMQTKRVLERGPFPKCGGCGELSNLRLICDKKSNHGYLCRECLAKYGNLLKPESPCNFWMCGACGYRILAGTKIDASVDQPGNPCPNCRSDVNFSLVNLSGDQPVDRGLIGEPLE